MLTKNDIKHIRSLGQPKYRKDQNCFVAEGKKVVNELIEGGMNVLNIYAVDENAISQPYTKVTNNEMSRISQLKSPPGLLAVFESKNTEFPSWDALNSGINLVLATVQDPGNVGTIVRTADWFGIQNIVLSKDSADVFSSKALQSTMGSICRVNIHYTELQDFFIGAKEKGISIITTSLNGESIYESDVPDGALLVMGNESKGLSQELLDLSDHQVKIPSYGKAESLNVAMATGIILSEIRRRS